ncbi:MAG TPA: type II secretion system F family protein [Longimicrobium sp.]
MADTFQYSAVDPVGRRVRGREHAANADALARALEGRGLLVVDMSRDAAPARPSGASSRRRAVLEATRAVAALLNAGLPLPRALRVSAHVATPELAEALNAVVLAVEHGEPLAGALQAHPRLFRPLYVGMVRAGERSGALGDAFARLAVHLEREEELRARLTSAMAYPLILATMGGATVVLLLVMVLPRFVELLDGSGAALPRSTAALLAMSAFLRRTWPLLLVAALLLGSGMAAARRSEGGRRALARLLLRAPGVGALRRQVLAARFARLLSVLLTGGAPLLYALDDTIESLDDPVARETAGRVRARVREGAPLHAAIAAEPLYPPVLGQLVAVGEESGRLGDFLARAAEMFDTGAERALRRLVTFAEPAMIVVFGGIVAFVALSLLQAIYGLNADALR